MFPGAQLSQVKLVKFGITKLPRVSWPTKLSNRASSLVS